MFHPLGPLPPSVYWRRRAVAGLGVVLAPALLFSGIAAAAPDDTAPPGTAASAAPTASPSPAAAPGAGDAVPDPLADTGLDSDTGLLSDTGLPGARTPDPSTAPTARSRAGSPSTAAATGGSTAAAPRCRDRDLVVTARTDRARYEPGATPVLSVVVTNTGAAPCSRDLDAARQALAVVRRPGDGLWGSTDCAARRRAADVRTLGPGEEAVFATTWSGRTSLPGCRGVRRTVAPGSYQVLVRLDDLVSDPVRLTLGR